MRSGLGHSTRVGFGESYVHHSYDAERRFAAPPKKVAPPVDPSAFEALWTEVAAADGLDELVRATGRESDDWVPRLAALDSRLVR